ncbi:MAG: DCC1-like thiol-disulfide oxidoreductase family protein [Actinomycetota bacterium]|nr:DCC1-like thiol-disulfide oxidoreductase family protein [Actinomycetota bacterium]
MTSGAGNGRHDAASPVAARPSRGPLLIFDGDCRWCSAAAGYAARHLHHGERVVAWQSLGARGLSAVGLSREDASVAAWWVDGPESRHRGHKAVGKALVATGGWRRCAGALALVPPTSWIAAGAYRVIVRTRSRLPGGTPACRAGR